MLLVSLEVFQVKECQKFTKTQLVKHAVLNFVNALKIILSVNPLMHNVPK